MKDLRAPWSWGGLRWVWCWVVGHDEDDRTRYEPKAYTIKGWEREGLFRRKRPTTRTEHYPLQITTVYCRRCNRECA